MLVLEGSTIVRKKVTAIEHPQSPSSHPLAGELSHPGASAFAQGVPSLLALLPTWLGQERAVEHSTPAALVALLVILFEL